MKCKGCKYYKEGLDIDYVPGWWCDLGIKDKENCKNFNNHYTIWDYVSECWLGILIVLIILIIQLLYLIF